MSTLAEQAIDALNANFGFHEGFRAAHAKGTVCTGTFTATPEATRLTKAAHMQGDPVTAIVRFSNAVGDPGRHDGEPGGRGMATKLDLPDGSARTDMVATTAERFFARTPEEFITVLRAGRDAPKPLRLGRLAVCAIRHLRAIRILSEGLGKPPLPSYANCRYNGLHAFKWVDSGGAETWVRYSWLPDGGEASLDENEAKQLDPDYLQRDLRDRLERGETVSFTLQLRLRADDDPVNDASVAWPEERETVVAGTLEVTGLDTQRETGGDVLVFDPKRLVDGIEPSDDPILHFRPKAYDESVKRRTAT